MMKKFLLTKFFTTIFGYLFVNKFNFLNQSKFPLHHNSSLSKKLILKNFDFN